MNQLVDCVPFALCLCVILPHRRMLLVQAVSQHRQRRPGDSVTSLLNLISAYRAQPEESTAGGSVGVVQWGEREELKELYGLFTGRVSNERLKLTQIQQSRRGLWGQLNKGFVVISCFGGRASKSSPQADTRPSRCCPNRESFLE
jgi:hypothetical protein